MSYYTRKPAAPPIRTAPRAGPDFSDPCALLADAQAKYYALMTGGATQVVETPLLGRVEFTPASAVDLARLISALQDRCNAAQGLRGTGRRPISFDTTY